MIVRGIVTTLTNDLPDDIPVPDGTTGEIRRLSDNSLVASVSTTDGWFEYSQNGSPGPFRINWDYANTVKNQYSKIVGPSGPVDLGNIPLVLRAFSNGVISGIASNLAVTATGSTMSVNVALGAALVQGIVYDHITAGPVTIDTAHATLGRIDTLVVEVTPPGSGEDIEGRSEIKVVKGTAAASPVAPTLTQTNSLYQFPLANITVGAAVSVIGSDKVTDRRTYAASLIPAGSITNTMLADTAKSLYAVKKSGTTINVEPVNRLNFNGAYFDVDVNAGFSGQQIDIDLIGGLGTSRASFMPISEFVATGAISSGTRTLITLGVGPLPQSVAYAVKATFFVTVRNQINNGTVALKMSIDGGTERTHEFQNVGGVPRAMVITQSATVTKNPGASFNVVCKVTYISGDPSDIRAGWVDVTAQPLNVLVP